MNGVNWQHIPNNLVDEAEELLRLILEEPELTLVIQGGICIGLSAKADLARSTKVEYDFNWLSERGLLAYINYAIFHPKHLALCRNPTTGESNGFLLSDEPWEFESSILREEISKTDAANIHIEGWNIPFGDC